MKELPDAAAVLAEAFLEDPVMREIRPPRSHVARTAELSKLFLTLIRTIPPRYRAVDVATLGDTVVGAAFWESPKPHPGGTISFVRQIPALLGVLGARGAVRAAQHLQHLQSARPAAPHWYLAEIGVSASARGTGVGGALLTHALERVDKARSGAYLESSTPQNRRLYRRHGFLDGAPLTGFTSAAPVSMWRPAAD